MYFNHLQCIPSYQGYPFTQFFLIPKRKEKKEIKKKRKNKQVTIFLQVLSLNHGIQNFKGH